MLSINNLIKIDEFVSLWGGGGVDDDKSLVKVIKGFK